MPSSSKAFASYDENTAVQGTRDTRAFASYDESVERLIQHSTQAALYAFENQVVQPRRSSAQAALYAYENQVVQPKHSTQAALYAYEQSTVAQDPGKLYVFNQATGQYERDPWWYYDTATATWKQAL